MEHMELAESSGDIDIATSKEDLDSNVSMLREKLAQCVSSMYHKTLQAGKAPPLGDLQEIRTELTMYRFVARIVSDLYGWRVASESQRAINLCFHVLNKFTVDDDSGSTSKHNVEMALQNRLEELWHDFTRVAREKHYEDMSISALENFTQEMKVHTAIIYHWQVTYKQELCQDLHKHCVQFLEHLKEKVREARANQDKENKPPHQYNLRPRTVYHGEAETGVRESHF